MGKLQTVLMVYSFAGQERRGDIKFWVNEFCGRHDLVAEVTEIDILRDPVGHDLGREEAQQHWLRQLRGYHIVAVTPPCCDHSRVRWANNLGPPTSRSPWLANAQRQKTDLFTSLLDFSFKVLFCVHELAATQPIFSVTEHPEDLGRIWQGKPHGVPASMWRTWQA